jgi:hypothetical protein
MEKILISHNRHWEKPYDGLYPRQMFPKLVSQLSARHIQVLQGIRRSGKSTVFKLMINHLAASEDPMEIVYLNLEDPFFIKWSQSPEKLNEVIDTARKLTGKKIRYLFLDEVQAINGWEKYVKTVYDNEVFEKIFITGSNASLLNGEFATLLTGRYLSSMVYPLSLSELLAIKNITSHVQMIRQKADVLALVDDMLRYGSFVEVFDSDEDLKREIVSTYYDAILLKDCVSNNHIRDIKSFRALSYYLISNITATYSYSSLGKAVGIHDKSAREFVQYLQQAYLLFELRLFSWSLKEQQNNRKKPYMIDNGFINLSFAFSSNSGRLLENLVFSELRKAGKEIYFYNKGFECDFIIKNADHSLAAIQVCHELTDRNKKREVGGLKKMDAQYPTVSKTIITYNQETMIDGIAVVPFWKFFGVGLGACVAGVLEC